MSIRILTDPAHHRWVEVVFGLALSEDWGDGKKYALHCSYLEKSKKQMIKSMARMVGVVAW